METFRILLTALLFLPVLKASTMRPSPFVRNGEPTNTTVMEGSFANFSCLLTHKQNYLIDWMFNLSYVTTNGSSEVIDKNKYGISVGRPAKVRVCKKIDRRQRASEPSKGNMEPTEQELQPVDPVILEDVDTKAGCDVRVESSFTSGPGEQSIDQLGEMNAPERKYGYYVKSAANDSIGLEVTGRDEKRFRNEEELVYTELDFHEDGSDARKTRSAPTPFLAETSVTTYATLQFQPSTDLKG